MASLAQQPTGTLDEALRRASAFLPAAPALAERQARAILDAVPGDPRAALTLGVARRLQGDARGAVAVLDPLARREPRSAATWTALGLAQRDAGDDPSAALDRAVALDPDAGEAWRALADLARLAGDDERAERAEAAAMRAAARDPELLRAAVALNDNRLDVAEHALRARLRRRPDDVAALRMLAEVASRLGRHQDSAALLATCLRHAPGFDAARQAHAIVLGRANRLAEALAEIDRLLARQPRNAAWQMVKASIVVRSGGYALAIDLYEDVLARHPTHPRTWLSYGHALKTVGRQADAVGAYRRAAALQPSLGETWWSLANLKTVRLDEADIAAIEAALDEAELGEEDRLHLHFALGKAREDIGADAEAFAHYAHGNAIRRAQLGYDADRVAQQVDRTIALLNPGFLAARAGQGCADPDPIFVVGLPRSGSTLVEQILASHPLVEGTMELPDLMAIAGTLGDGTPRYPASLADLDANAPAAIGRDYLARTRVQRHTGRPFFVDKMPNNWLHVALVMIALPNARIVDARRHPLGCGFSAFKQHFARGQGFSYDLGDLGRYYRDYVRLMGHVDRVAPGRVHRVIHERLATDTETEVRALLAACGLPFDEACLRFWETDRAVRTASSEQVRRPISRDGVDRWRRFERFLDPLKAALGPAIDTWDTFRERPVDRAAPPGRTSDGA